MDREATALRRAQAELGASPHACFADLAGALRSVACDAVVICLPIALHAPIAAQALAAGKHVVVEKPFTATLQEAEDLVRLAEPPDFPSGRSNLETLAIIEATLRSSAAAGASMRIADVVASKALG